MTNTNETAGTILAQIGGQKAMVMMGAMWAACERGMVIKPGRNGGRITAIRIELHSDDTYSMHFFRGKGVKMNEVRTLTGLYAEDLGRFITDETGLYLSL